jgi:hypothetical protein
LYVVQTVSLNAKVSIPHSQCECFALHTSFSHSVQSEFPELTGKLACSRKGLCHCSGEDIGHIRRPCFFGRPCLFFYGGQLPITLSLLTVITHDWSRINGIAHRTAWPTRKVGIINRLLNRAVYTSICIDSDDWLPYLFVLDTDRMFIPVGPPSAQAIMQYDKDVNGNIVRKQLMRVSVCRWTYGQKSRGMMVGDKGSFTLVRS